ncbi:undecaprenyldiphospho-muramoylpentapeptide beta-N-acetylglucosaminyltransferase [Runella sp. MFBS21]|uniref:undecaprenyldiphospho-muramoylpentapeptide beta-N-acetylglucosaminyltransferase n=1 Tax=Runella sp. MFBS21 TaxID=3034018 RepID=UPI0023F9F46D|nr:undecaprenyldiphospho-muramoylpentapeptide beta-N-acetylglucosaminyltransferase [Runella sp. MFBS21]MDF7821690.1 undecaprenyldiphospho-muramoylpentapeptide beta-N-acetylglucosaminyltransferase [Runella sp. MFBS21]
MIKKVIISGGGTGGHIYPAIAIANALKATNPSIEILFVGALGKMEMEKVPKAGYEIIGLPISGIKRELSLDNLSFPIKLTRSLLKARSIINSFKPDVAIGVGGFASGPLLMIASLMGIPTLIQEQNSYAGITNKLLAKRAKAICVAYPHMEAFFPKNKLKLTGNPVRSDILNVEHKHQRAYEHFGLQPNRKTLLVIGGSLGAKTINESIEAGLRLIIESGYQILWQTGKPYADKAKSAVDNLKTPYVKASDFIYEMDLAYASADVVVSRAGALSVSELCLVAKPAILVPFPFASEDHQTKNAMSLVEQNAALLVKDKDAKEELVQTALRLLQDTAKQRELSINIKKLAKPDAAMDIAQAILQL